MSESNDRYKVELVKSNALEGNPLNSPIERKLHVYLPPDYYQSETKRYPVIYFIHGYDGNSKNLTITTRWDSNPNLPIEFIPPELIKMIETDKIASYEKIDQLIVEENWKPFILVQPDSSLHIPHYMGIKSLAGLSITKGSFYLNSKYTGNYIDYIIKDVINFVDSNFRTISDKEHRGLMGASMGGYGVLSLCTFHPEKFFVAVSLSPANLTIDYLNHQLINPLSVTLFGEEEAKKMGTRGLHDIFDTFDLIFSKERPLLPSIKRDESGKILEMDEEAVRNWEKYDIKNLIKNNPQAFKDVKLWITCHEKDEFGLAKELIRIHETLLSQKIEHKFEVNNDSRADIAPHTLGVGYQVLPAIRFCLQNFA